MKLPIAVLFHPIDTFRQIRRYREHFTYLPVIVLLLLVVAVRVGYIHLVHFPLAAIEPRDANMLLETIKLLVPILTWVVATYAVTTIMGGEAEIKEILLAAAYAMVPYVLLTIPLAGISRVMSGEEADIYAAFQTAILTWVVLLFYLSVQSLHSYSLGKTILVCLLSLFAMALIWALLILVYAMTGNLRAFFQGVVLEIYMRFQ